MARIFVSYSRTDETFARQLVQRLNIIGADIWIDVEDIQAGVKWSQAIQTGLDSSDVMLVIISPDSMASENVTDEWQYFLDHKKAVIPILYRPAKIHFQLNRIQYIDFHTLDFELALRKLHVELAVQGVRLQDMPPAATLGVSPHTPPTRTALQTFARKYQAFYLAVGGSLLILALMAVTGLGVLLTRNNDKTLTDDPVTNAENFLQALADRNFGIANELVCEGIQVSESTLWGTPIDSINCQTGNAEDEVICAYISESEQFITTFVMDSENRICGQK